MSSTSIYRLNYNVDNFAPTRLYIKSVDLKGGKRIFYFGKYTKENIYDYPGSGVRWLKTIKKYGLIPSTLWVSGWYYDCIELQKAAIHFSLENNIVESKFWANMVIENGLDGVAKRSYKPSTCGYCGINFSIICGWVPKYCSKECRRAKSNEEKESRKIITLVECPNCNALFQYKGTTCCSRSCARLYIHKTMSAEKRAERSKFYQKTSKIKDYHWTKFSKTSARIGMKHSETSINQMRENSTKLFYNATSPEGEVLTNVSMPFLVRAFQLNMDALRKFLGRGKIPNPKTQSSESRNNTTGWSITRA